MSLVWTTELSDTLEYLPENLKIRKLTDVPKNQIVKFSDAFEETNESIRIAEMGFIPNIEIKIIRNDGKNPLIIETKNVRLMISRKLAEGIYVIL
ncbi:MAG: hypothetical protein HeimC2_16880 [Candidatus Heimdallarchaeota archaeon LC_2]|nr:MAG: hypothetical protein HeimC2_16880 [Candidatus Heimdallarchaeota archaeon LC_2]